MKIIDYKILETRDSRTRYGEEPYLHNQVKQAIQEGWQPLGGVAFDHGDGGRMFQAMVKYGPVAD